MAISREIAKVAFGAALLLLGGGLARSVEPDRGEWRPAGQGFACIVTTPQKLPPSVVNPDTLALACLHLGPFVIGADASALAAVLGAPHRTLDQPNGAKALAWFLGEPGRYPYFIATVLDEHVVALQVTGLAAVKGYGFNHIDLGDSTQTLTERFGAPFEVTKSEEPDTDQWSYPPWPFSFEVKAGRVTSIRIVDSAHWK